MPFLRAHKPKHAKPSKAAPVLAAGGLTASFAAVDLAALASPAAAAASSDFARLRACESGGNYAINTGNGYYGAYQFDLQTWRGLGYSGLPSEASPGTQDEAAARLQASRGWSPWPACSRSLGLGRTEGSTLRASRSRVTSTPVVVRPAVQPRRAPAFEGTLTTATRDQNLMEVRRWQHRMRSRGWDLAVDGRFGPKSAAVAARFAAEKGFKVTPGTVDNRTWRAAWQTPVS